jgi:hypothetical protein
MVVSGKRLYFYFSGRISRYTLHRGWERSITLCRYNCGQGMPLFLPGIELDRYILILKLFSVCGKSIPSDHKLCRWIPNLALLIRIRCARYLVSPFSVAHICKESDRGEVELCNVATVNRNEKFWVNGKSHSSWGKKTSETIFNAIHLLYYIFQYSSHIFTSGSRNDASNFWKHVTSSDGSFVNKELERMWKEMFVV